MENGNAAKCDGANRHNCLDASLAPVPASPSAQLVRASTKHAGSGDLEGVNALCSQ